MSKTSFSKFGVQADSAAAAPAGTIPPKADSPKTTALALFGRPEATSALMAVTDQAEGGQKSPFPIIQVTGGATGGLYGAVKGTADQDVLDMLPQGGKPVKGIFLAYRTEVIAWPEGYSEDREEKAKPSWAGVIPAGAVADAQLAFKACEAYQFTKKDDKAKFDYAASGVGHIRPSLQMLVFVPEIENAVIVQVPAYFSSWVETQKSLRLLVDPETKQLGQFPCSIRVVTTEQKNKARTQSWKVHHCDVVQAVDQVTKAAFEKYQPWVEKLQTNPDMSAVFQEWLDGGDRPMTDEHRAALRKATAL